MPVCCVFLSEKPIDARFYGDFAPACAGCRHAESFARQLLSS
jgi:hypothetical protein